MRNFPWPARTGFPFDVGKPDLKSGKTIGDVNESELHAFDPPGLVVETGLKTGEPSVREIDGSPLNSFSTTAHVIVESELDSVESVGHDINRKKKTQINTAYITVDTINKVQPDPLNRSITIGVLNGVKH